MLQKLSILLLIQARCYSTKNVTIKDIAGDIKHKYNKIMVMVGAGLSTPSGIPDFRTPGAGLYSNLQKYKLPNPEAIFDLQFFKKEPKPFFDLAKELYPGKYKPNIGHYFIYLLQEKGKLLRLYTQNIDGLERLAGIKEELLVEAHGTFATASCIKCKEKFDPSIVRADVFNDIVTRCHLCQGIVKPDIVFFGEELPERYHNYSNIDPDKADLLLVMGTSLAVYPFAWSAETFPKTSPRLLLNRETVGSFGDRNSDMIINDDIVNGTEKLVKELGWWDELNDLIKR